MHQPTDSNGRSGRDGNGGPIATIARLCLPTRVFVSKPDSVHVHAESRMSARMVVFGLPTSFEARFAWRATYLPRIGSLTSDGITGVTSKRNWNRWPKRSSLTTEYSPPSLKFTGSLPSRTVLPT